MIKVSIKPPLTGVPGGTKTGRMVSKAEDRAAIQGDLDHWISWVSSGTMHLAIEIQELRPFLVNYILESRNSEKQ